MSDVPAGRFAWCELMTSDPEAAESFYTKVTGWSAVPWEDIPESNRCLMIAVCAEIVAQL